VPEDARPQDRQTIEKMNRVKYEQYYSAASLCPVGCAEEDEYFSELTRIRFALITKYAYGKTALDLCCGTGYHLLETRHLLKSGVGVDFSLRMISAAKSKKEMMHVQNVEFVVCNARQIPFREGTFDCVYSFSSLYYIPWHEEVVFEVARVLKPGSIAILEFGNLHSLNTIVCRAYPELAIPCHIATSEMNETVRDAGLEVLRRRRFQILPLWGNKPWWLRPLLHPLWKRVLKREIGQKMIDEHICSMRVLGSYCFRHILICRKI